MKKLFDISLPITPELLTYPGNPEVIFDEQRGSSTLTKITFGTHTGTHVDAPTHVFDNNKPLHTYPLENFIGACRVIDVTEAEEAITIKDLEDKNIEKNERLLFKTKNSLHGFENFTNDFIYLDGDCAEWLAEITRRPLLVGVDYLSIKQRGSSDNRPHTALLQYDIPILEGLDLSEVTPGSYELLFLPLRLDDRDGAPGRAVLRSL